MSIKAFAPILILLASIFFSFGAKSQISNVPFLKNSSLLVGVSVSKMLLDPIYDQDLPRFTAGYLYNHTLSKKLTLDFGGLFSAKGGKSFYEDNFQTFSYFDVPIKANYVFGEMFKIGMGLQGSVFISNQAKTTGTKRLLEPNPHPYFPNKNDYSFLVSMDIGLSNTTALCLLSSFSLNSSIAEPSLHFWHTSATLCINFGKSAQRVETIIKNAHQGEIDFLAIKNGYVLVILSDRENNIKFFEEKGDTQLVNLIKRDAEIKNNALKRAFSSKFTFTKVLFIYSNQIAKAHANNPNTLLEDVDGNTLELKSLNGASYVFFKPADVYENINSFSRDGYYFMDLTGQKLYDPWPALNFASVVNLDMIDKMVADLNRRLLTREEEIRAKRYFSKSLHNLE